MKDIVKHSTSTGHMCTVLLIWQIQRCPRVVWNGLLQRKVDESRLRPLWPWLIKKYLVKTCVQKHHRFWQYRCISVPTSSGLWRHFDQQKNTKRANGIKPWNRCGNSGSSSILKWNGKSLLLLLLLLFICTTHVFCFRPIRHQVITVNRGQYSERTKCDHGKQFLFYYLFAKKTNSYSQHLKHQTAATRFLNGLSQSKTGRRVTSL